MRRVGRVSMKNKCVRAVWNVVWLFLFRPFATRLFWPWRWMLLRMFGARVHFKAHVYASARIWAPWNLEIHEGGCIGAHVICYNQDKVCIEANAVVSQYACLCTASHDIKNEISSCSGLITAPIWVKTHAWIGMRAYVGMGVVIGASSVVGATSSVFKDVEDGVVVGGNPAMFIKKRISERVA